MSRTLTGAIGLIAGRMTTRAEGAEDDPNAADAAAEEAAAAEGDPKEPEGDEGAPAAEGDPVEPEGDEPAADDGEGGDAMSADYSSGYAAANLRAATILGSEHASRVPTLAATLAFETKMSADDAVATMAAASADVADGGKPASTLASRMSGHKAGVKPEPAPKPNASGGDAGLLASAQARFSRTRRDDNR